MTYKQTVMHPVIYSYWKSHTKILLPFILFNTIIVYADDVDRYLFISSGTPLTQGHEKQVLELMQMHPKERLRRVILIASRYSTGLKLENYYFFTFTFSWPEVGKLFHIYLFFYFFFFLTWSWKIIPYLLFYFFSNWSWEIIP